MECPQIYRLRHEHESKCLLLKMCLWSQNAQWNAYLNENYRHTNQPYKTGLLSISISIPLFLLSSVFLFVAHQPPILLFILKSSSKRKTSVKSVNISLSKHNARNDLRIYFFFARFCLKLSAIHSRLLKIRFVSVTSCVFWFLNWTTKEQKQATTTTTRTKEKKMSLKVNHVPFSNKTRTRQPNKKGKSHFHSRTPAFTWYLPMLSILFSAPLPFSATFLSFVSMNNAAVKFNRITPYYYSDAEKLFSVDITVHRTILSSIDALSHSFDIETIRCELWMRINIDGCVCVCY